MTIHFSPYYDAGVWSGEPARGECRKDEAFLGPLGLLDQLELRLGLTSRPVPSYKLFMQWLDAVSVAKEKGPCFYSKSLQTDRLGTAARLLEWRDALVLCGWSCGYEIPEKLSKGAREILGGLAAADAVFRASGGRMISDRWRAVLGAIPTSGIEQETIAIDVPLDMLEPLWRKLIIMLKDAGWKVSSPESLPDIPKDIEVLHFKDYVDACTWFAHQDESLLAIARDEFTLDLAIEAVGKAPISSDTSASCHLLSHLFQDTLRLLEPSVNRNTLVSYLSVTPHPLDRYKDKDGRNALRFRLLNHIVNVDGFGEDRKGRTFDSIVGEYDIPDEDRTFWLPHENRQGSVSLHSVELLCDHLEKWASEASGDSRTRQQLQQIVDACVALRVLIKGLGYVDALPTADFKKLLTYVCSADVISWTSAAVGSLPVAPGPFSIADSCDRAVWLDCAADVTKDVFPFFSPVDLVVLHEDESLDFPLREETIIQSDACCRASLAHVARLEIAFSDKIATETPDKHPLLIEIAGKKAPQGKVRDWLDSIPYAWPGTARLIDVPFIPARTEQSQYDLGENFFSIPEAFSFSSIDLLLERPFDYVLKYIIGCYDENDGNITTAQGLVGHLVIREMVRRAKGDRVECTADDLSVVFSRDFDEVFDWAVRSQGLLLLLPENLLWHNEFRSRLKADSLPALLDIIRQSRLKVLGSEVQCDGEIPRPGIDTSIKVNAQIDMLLKDENGGYAIFDFKWNGRSSEKEKKTLIEEGKDYQLAIYRELVKQGYVAGIPKGAVCSTSYFMLRSGVLYTDSTVFKSTKGTIEVVKRKEGLQDPLKNLFDEFDAVVEDLRGGIVEVVNSRIKNKSSVKDYGENRVLKGKLN